MTLRKVTRDTLRMSGWLVIAVALYFLTFDFGLQESHPGLQATIYTVANITLRAYIGYWIARSVLGRLKLDGTDAAGKMIARAIVIAAAVMTSR